MSEWRMWAHVYDNGELWNLWPDRRSLQSYGLEYPQVQLDVREVAHDDEAGTHWGWLDRSQWTGEWDAQPSMIYPRRELLDMCFPGGRRETRDREAAEKGRVVRLVATPCTDAK